MRMGYKYYSGVTSQLAFCATPLRLDSYSSCQFNCNYCFARTREGFGRDEALKAGSPKALRARLERVSRGVINSLVDEFISHRIPFQLGGMSDPFTPIESKERVTLEYLRVLKDYDYPYMISTKSTLPADREYLDLISGANSYVRFSTTVVRENVRSLIDRGCPSLDAVAAAAESLANKDIPVSFRMQPVIPGHEDAFGGVLKAACNSGVRHISVEYLKVPLEANSNFGKTLSGILDGSPISKYIEFGAVKRGSEYGLPLSYRIKYLPEMFCEVRARGMTFGFADNDLLLHSDGSSCCNAANLYLRNAGFFLTNIVGFAKKKKIGEKLRFSELLREWVPEKSISTSLNSKSRIIISDSASQEWVEYLREIWCGRYGVYSPDYFDGVISSGEMDDCGMPIYVRVNSEFQSALSLNVLHKVPSKESCSIFSNAIA